MADAVDLAQEQECAFRESALAHKPPVPTPGAGSEVCKRCHGDVPRRRAALGYHICVDCQSDIEARAGR